VTDKVVANHTPPFSESRTFLNLFFREFYYENVPLRVAVSYQLSELQNRLVSTKKAGRQFFLACPGFEYDLFFFPDLIVVYIFLVLVTHECLTLVSRLHC